MIMVQLQSCCISGWDADLNSSTSFSPHYCAVSIKTKAAVDTYVPLRYEVRTGPRNCGVGRYLRKVILLNCVKFCLP